MLALSLRNLGRAIRGGAFVAAAYVVYVLTVVPWVEPTAAARRSHFSDDDAPGTRSTDRFMAELSALFPAGSWELDNPKVLKSDGGVATIILREYNVLADGSLQIKPFTVVFYPNPPPGPSAPSDRTTAGEEPRHAPVIMQAAEGAILAFDKPIDPQRGVFGHPVGGRLVGDIHIYSVDPTTRTVQLQIKTSNVHISNQRIWSREKVHFRFGQNYGVGEDLLIELEDQGSWARAGAATGSLKTIAVQKLEILQLYLENDGLFAGLRSTESGTAADKQLPPENQTVPPEESRGGSAGAAVPVQITCSGPLSIDVAARKATLEQNVELRRVNPHSLHDRLNCQRLTLLFDDTAVPLVASDQRDDGLPDAIGQPATRLDKSRPAASEGVSLPSSLANLTIRRAVATGDPVTIHAPSRKAYVEAQRLEYDAKTNRVDLKGLNPFAKPDSRKPSPALYQDERHSILATEVSLQLASEGVGSVRASGPGRYRGVGPELRGSRLEAGWTESLEIIPGGADYFVRLRGDAYVASSDRGHVRSHTIETLVTREVPAADAEDSTSTMGGSRSGGAHDDQKTAPRFSVKQVRATAREGGVVEIDAPQLVGKLAQLDLVFLPDSSVSTPSATPGVGQGTGRDPVDNLPGGNPTPPGLKRPEYRVAATGTPGAGQASLAPPDNSRRPGTKYELLGGRATLWVQQAAEVRLHAARIDGPTVLTELPASQADGLVDSNDGAPATPPKNRGPLEISAERIEVRASGSESPGANATAAPSRQSSGFPPDSSYRVTVFGSPAVINARGVSLRGDQMTVDQMANRLVVVGPGSVAFRIPADNAEKILVAGSPVNVSWQGSLNFDGQKLTFLRQVAVLTALQELRSTHALQILLTSPIDFSDLATGQQQPQILSMAAEGNVTLQNRRFDVAGELTSLERLDVRDLRWNQQTGEITGVGPGWFSRTFFDSPMNLSASRGTAARPDDNAASSPRLMGLNVAFRQGIKGNVQDSVVRFGDLVEAIYGPVARWDEIRSPQSELRPDDVRTSCQVLTVAEVQQAVAKTARERETSLELLADGSAQVEGLKFYATGNQIKFSEAKDMLILEGDPQRPAEVYTRDRPGGPTARSVQRRIRYSPSRQAVLVEDGRGVDVSNLPEADLTRGVER